MTLHGTNIQQIPLKNQMDREYHIRNITQLLMSSLPRMINNHCCFLDPRTKTEREVFLETFTCCQNSVPLLVSACNFCQQMILIVNLKYSDCIHHFKKTRRKEWRKLSVFFGKCSKQLFIYNFRAE